MNQVKILIVDDEEDVSTLIRRYVSDEYQTKWAADGKEALEIIDNTYDIVYLDRMMDEISGEEVAERISQRDLDVKVAIISAKPVDFDVLGMEIDAYIEKPASKEQIRSVTEDMLVRAQYVESVQEIFALIEQRKIIQQKKTRDELSSSEEYEQLCAEIRERRKDLIQGDNVGMNNTQGQVALMRELTSNATSGD